MGRHHGFNIGSFFKDVGHKVEDVVTHPADAVKLIASVSPVSAIVNNLPQIVKTIEPLADRGLKTIEHIGGGVFKEGENLVGGAFKGIEGLAGSMMMPLMIGGAVVLLILLKK